MLAARGWGWEVNLSSPDGDDLVEDLREGLLRTRHGAAPEWQLHRYGDCALSGRAATQAWQLAPSSPGMVRAWRIGWFEPLLFPKTPEARSPAKGQDPTLAIFFSPLRCLPAGCWHMGDRPERADGISSPFPGGRPEIQNRNGGHVGLADTFMVEMIPSHRREETLGFYYTLRMGIASLSPPVIGWASERISLSKSFLILGLVAGLSALLICFAEERPME